MNMNLNTPASHTPTLGLYHATARGTGSALRLSLHPATADAPGFLELKLAAEKAPLPRPTAAGFFDWENAIRAELRFDAVAKMQQVFRGECENLDDGYGICLNEGGGLVTVRLRHEIEPRPCYVLECAAADADGGRERRILFSIRPYEALGVSEALSASMAAIAFGIGA